MSNADLTVLLRTQDGKSIAVPVKFDGERVFAVIYEYGPNGKVLSQDWVQLDTRYLQRIDLSNGAHFVYKKNSALPTPELN